MKVFHTIVFSFLFLIVSYAQVPSMSKEYKKEVIASLSQLMNDFYVFPEVAKETEKHLLSEFKKGNFESYTNHEDFAKALTEAVQFINKDGHMRINKKPAFEKPDNSPERLIEEKLYQMQRSRAYNGGFLEAKVLEENIGYIKISGFAYLGEGRHFADAYMKLIEQTDAVIIDLSRNFGGDPAMVQYLCSYFFDEIVHLNSLYFREGDRTIDFYTLDEVDGKKMPDVPLFVITSSKTFSGAEEFSYNMQTQKRATLIGSTTGGGANPGGYRDINDSLRVFIPTGRAINPITKTNWEGVGVVPEIQATDEEALKKTIALAKEAAIQFRANQKEKYTEIFKDVIQTIEAQEKTSDASTLQDKLALYIKQGVISEQDINMLGYQYFMEYGKTVIGTRLFKINTILFPDSPNVHDSYGEAMMMNGDLKASLASYQKAVDIATKNESPDAEFYKDNMQRVMDMIKEKKE